MHVFRDRECDGIVCCESGSYPVELVDMLTASGYCPRSVDIHAYICIIKYIACFVLAEKFAKLEWQTIFMKSAIFVSY